MLIGYLQLPTGRAHTTTYTYDNANHQTGIAYPNEVVGVYSYDEAGRLLGISYSQDGNPLESISYALDNVGNRLSMTDTDGVTSYTYDDINRLTGVTYSSGTPVNVNYTYDPMGNRLIMVQDGISTSYTYDDADRLLTATTDGLVTNYTWDNNGNLLTRGAETFTWDGVNHLVGWTDDASTASYIYNGDGIRVARTVNDMTTAYLQDQAAGLPVVLRETTEGVTVDYVYGIDLIALMDDITTSYYHIDGLGSTRLLTDNTGTVTDRYSYDAFGTARIHTGVSEQSFTFTGEQTDPECGLVYLRARYYDPVTGRFTSKDPFIGNDFDSQSHNLYVYTRNNPGNLIDPSGLYYIYHAERLSAFLGLGASIQRSEYYDPNTGERKVLWNAGIGAGLPGLKVTAEAGGSTANIPREGISIQTHGGINLGSEVGISSEFNLTSGYSSITPRFGNTKIKLSGNMDATPAVTFGAGGEASGTFNVTFQQGALGDWFFNLFIKPQYDIQYYQMQAEHYRRMTEIYHRRNTLVSNSPNYSNWGGPPSQGK